MKRRNHTTMTKLCSTGEPKVEVKRSEEEDKKSEEEDKRSVVEEHLLEAEVEESLHMSKNLHTPSKLRRKNL
jgi:hypothetical protein